VRLGPLLALAPVRRRRIDQIAIVDGTLVPTRDHRLATRSKNYRYSTNPQVAIDGDYQGNTDVIMPYRRPRDGTPLTDWQEDLNTTHRKVRARVEHTLARLKNWKTLRDYRRAAHTLYGTASGIANLHNIALTG
jgi:hypothetical protein